MTSEPSSRRSRMPIAVAIVLVIGIAVAVAVANGAFRGGGAAAASPDASVEGVVPADANVVAEGRAVPIRSIELQVGAPGTVASIDAAEGAAVAAGDPLLSLDTTAADAEVDAATASVDAASAGVNQAKASLAQAEANAVAARAAVAGATAARRAAAAGRDALPGAASSAQKRQASAQVDQADAALDQAKAQRTQANAAVTGARAAVKAAEADLARAEASKTSATTARDQLRITAPFAGTVVSVEPAVGDHVQPGVVLVRLADLTAWRFETSDLSETSVARVAVGAPATITIDGIPDANVTGTVESVGTFGSTNQGDIVYPVVVTPTSAVPDGLRWNMTVTMEIDGTAGH
jgi:multidrug resistance efflux pump